MIQDLKQLHFYLDIENAYYKVGRWAAIAVFKQYLWNGWTDLENRFYKIKRPHRGTHGRSLIPFGLMTSSHKQKKTFFCPSVTLVLGYSSVISLKDLGRKISGLLTPTVSFSYFFKFWLETGEFEEKVKKEVFWMGKNRQTWLFLCHAHRSPWRFLRVLLFFPVRRHVSDVPFYRDELCRS